MGSSFWPLYKGGHHLKNSPHDVQTKGGGAKGLLNNVKKTAFFSHVGFHNTTKDFFHPPRIKLLNNLAGEPVDHGAERRPSPAWRRRRQHCLGLERQPTVCHFWSLHDLVRRRRDTYSCSGENKQEALYFRPTKACLASIDSLALRRGQYWRQMISGKWKWMSNTWETVQASTSNISLMQM